VRDLFITADAGGSNSYRSHVWKFELQRVADKLDLSSHVSHFPPGTSKWNKVEHRLFSFISMNWRGRPLRTYETIVNLIGDRGEIPCQGVLPTAGGPVKSKAGGRRARNAVSCVFVPACPIVLCTSELGAAPSRPSSTGEVSVT